MPDHQSFFFMKSCFEFSIFLEQISQRTLFVLNPQNTNAMICLNVFRNDFMRWRTPNNLNRFSLSNWYFYLNNWGISWCIKYGTMKLLQFMEVISLTIRGLFLLISFLNRQMYLLIFSLKCINFPLDNCCICYFCTPAYIFYNSMTLSVI